MRAAALIVAATGCQYSLDSLPVVQCEVNMASPACVEAASSSAFTFIKTNIFDPNCFSSSCHEANGAAKLKISQNVSQTDAYKNLLGPDGMGAFSTIDPTRRLVVPGDPRASYLELMIQKIPPGSATPPAAPPPPSIGFMPQTSGILCCQKLDAIDSWIAAGAMND